MPSRRIFGTRFKKAIKHWSEFIWWVLVLNHVDLLARLGAPRSARPGEILIVRLEGIGDFTLFLDFARQLRRLYPPGRFRITLVGARLWTSLAKGQSCFDEVWELDQKRFLINLIERYRLLQRVSRAGFSTAVNATFSRDLLFSDPVIRASLAPARIGFAGDLYKTVRLGRWVSGRWYTHLVTGVDSGMMELRKGALLLRSLGLSDSKAQMPDLESLTETSKGLPEYFYVLVPGAGSALRKWPADSFSRLADKLFAQTGWTGLICGSTEDIDTAATIVSYSRARLINYAGKLNLPELASVLKRARLVVGNETGTVHMAAAVATPSVCILGGGHFGRFMPYDFESAGRSPAPRAASYQMKCFGCDWRCIHKRVQGAPAPCIANVAVESVWSEVQAIIEHDEAAASVLDA
jgi:ADP-heptose:LPS heptosyltransferase